MQHLGKKWNCVMTATRNVYPRVCLCLFPSLATSVCLGIHDLRHSLKKQMGYKKITWQKCTGTEEGQYKKFAS